MKRLLMFFSFIAIGCGSGEIPVEPEQDPVGPVLDAGPSDSSDESATEAYRSMLTGTCKKAFDCCEPSTARAISGMVNREECDANALQGLSSIAIQQLDVAVAAGTVRIDEAAAELCEAAIGDLTCEEWTRVAPTELEASGCREAIEPMLDENVECAADFECRSGACIEATDGVSRCATLRDPGQTCDPTEGQLCKPGSYCDNFDAQACVQLLDDGVVCASGFDCASGLCDTGPAGTNVCTPQRGVCSSADG